MLPDQPAAKRDEFAIVRERWTPYLAGRLSAASAIAAELEELAVAGGVGLTPQSMNGVDVCIIPLKLPAEDGTIFGRYRLPA
jgi:hypothetical protein